MKNIILLLTILSICWSCNNDNSQKAIGSPEIPALLQRQAVIGPTEEMGNVNDLYNGLVAKIKANPKNYDARLNLAELFMQEARISGEHGHYFPAALTIVNAVLNENPEQGLKYRAMLDKASVLLSLHQFAEAKKIGEEAVKLNPYDAGIYGVLVDANVELGNYEEAVKMSDKMISVRPDIRSYSRISYLREIHGQPEGSIEAMKLAVSAGYPGLEQTEWARLVLGNLYKNYGYLDSAEIQYNIALSMRPNYPFAVAALADVEALKGNETKAKELLEKACTLIPEVGFYVDLAKMEKEKGNTERAKKLTNEILVMLADDEASGHMMSLEYAEVYMDLLDNMNKALEYAKKEYAARPDNIDVNKSLAVIYYRKGDYNKSNEHLIKALKTKSKNPELLCLEGLLMLKNSANIEGKQLIRQAFSSNPNLNCSYCNEAKQLL
ncbi:MAG: hypothetical protein IPJ74_12515 [Saprospiraceae bacterium]|nr:hypothetical protein [Saprospiraceae bacterium]